MVIYVIVVLLVILALGTLCEHDYKLALMTITERTGLSEDVAGATVIAAGTSSPALFLSLIALMQPSATDDTGAGTIVGSAIFNVCITIGLSALFSPEGAVVRGRPVIRDVVFNVLAFCWIMGSFADGFIYWYEAMLGMMLYGVYVVFMVFNSKVMRLVDRVFGAAMEHAWSGGEMPELGEYDENNAGNASEDQTLNNDEEEINDDGIEELIGGENNDSMVVQEHDTQAPATMDMEATNDSEQPAMMTSVDLEAPPLAASDSLVQHEFYVWKTICGRRIYRIKVSLASLSSPSFFLRQLMVIVSPFLNFTSRGIFGSDQSRCESGF